MADANERYLNAMHAVQSGIAMQMATDPKVGDPKDLRVGVTSAHVTDLGLAQLLMAKGVFTPAEYIEAVAVAAEKEQANMEAELTKKYGRPISLA